MSEEQSSSKFVAPDSQRKRWLKYGSNVILTSAIVVVLACLVVFLAQYKAKRVDMTAMRVYSLKPQTVNLIQKLNSPIKIISLYQHPESGGTDYGQLVTDLLEEYKRNGRNIDVESIDPVSQPTKVDDLVTEVSNKYGGEITKYKTAINAYFDTYNQIKSIADAEFQKVTKLPMDKLQNNQELSDTLGLAILTVQDFPKQLEQLKDRVDKITKTKLPNYRGATDAIGAGMVTLSSAATQIVSDFQKAKDDAKVPAEFRAYITESLPHYEQIKKLADTLSDQLSKLGGLKLDDLRQSLRAKDTILVMGDKDMRVIPAEQVWQTDKDFRGAEGSDNLKPRFAGEQQISTAILGLTMGAKPKVCFVRPTGPPLTTSNPFMRAGPFSRVADRLRDYNFQVLEKDLSGQFAQQAQMQGMPVEKEPTDDEIKDAVWIVLGFPNQQGPMPANPELAGKLAAHLKSGGSALVLFFPQGDNFDTVLKDWGIEANTNAIVVHEKIALTDSADELERVKQVPFVFLLRDYGTHAITKPLQSLDGVFAPMISVKTRETHGVSVTPLLPTPALMKCWGETDITALENDRSAKFEPDKGDIPGPLWGGAASEKLGGGRVVAIGAPQFAFNTIVAEPDPAMWKKGYIVSRFPGNAELFVNSVFWLAHMDTMLAISPAAMEAPRIANMTAGELKFWRVGVLILGLPALALITGIGVYFARRD